MRGTSAPSGLTGFDQSLGFGHRPIVTPNVTAPTFEELTKLSFTSSCAIATSQGSSCLETRTVAPALLLAPGAWRLRNATFASSHHTFGTRFSWTLPPTEST